MMGSQVMKRRSLGLLAVGCAFVLLVLPLWAQQEGENAVEKANENEMTIPEGTEFKLQLHSTISSKTSRPGDRILTTLLDPVAVEDQDALAKGVRIDGHIAEVKPAGRRGKGGYLSLVFDTIELPNGQKLAILGSLTEVFSSEGGGDPNVGPEGDLKGGGASRKTQAAIIASTTAVVRDGRVSYGHCGGRDGCDLGHPFSSR